MVVDHMVASTVSVVIADIVVDIALAAWFALALILLCCYGDQIRKLWIVIVLAFCDSICDSSCASFLVIASATHASHQINSTTGSNLQIAPNCRCMYMHRNTLVFE